jgi:hypothetical protein
MRLSCVVSQYLLGNLGDAHYFLLRMLLSYDMKQVCLVVGCGIHVRVTKLL